MKRPRLEEWRAWAHQAYGSPWSWHASSAAHCLPGTCALQPTACPVRALCRAAASQSERQLPAGRKDQFLNSVLRAPAYTQLT